jgi:hypothetical protein
MPAMSPGPHDGLRGRNDHRFDPRTDRQEKTVNAQLTYDAHGTRIEDLRRLAERRRRTPDATGPATPADTPACVRAAASITIRRSTAADRAALERLAALDSAPRLTGEVLLAELDGEAAGAIEVASGATIADPFRPTAELVELLRVRAVGLRGAAARRRPRLRLRLRAAYRAA